MRTTDASSERFSVFPALRAEPTIGGVKRRRVS
jgi:hypothetical protein